MWELDKLKIKSRKTKVLDAYLYGKYSYHANGSIATEELHEMDIERTYSYNARGGLTGIGGDYFTQSLTYTSGGYDGDSYYTGLIASTSYEYSWSNPGTGYPTAPSGYTWRYRYDSRGQLLTAENTLGSAYSVGVGSTNVMQYDAHGNITRFNQGNTTRSNTYVAGTNRLYYNNWLMYNYDTSGRIIGREASMGIETFTYDPYVGKPATVMGQFPVRYGYGGGSQRVLKEVNYTSPSPQKTVYIHGLGDYPLAEYRNHGPDPVTRYVYGPSGLLAIHKGLQGTILFPLKDHLGSSRVVLETKPQGSGRQVKPVAVYDYWPFGADMQTAGGVAGYRYTGQEYEAETDMYNYRARLYSQHMGHFMAPDPAGQFHSPYVAMGNNPVNMVDPDGELAWFVPVIVGAALGAYTGASIQSGTANFTQWKRDAWKGAIIGGIVGAGSGAMFSSAVGATGITASGTATKSWGITTSIINSANINMGSTFLFSGGQAGVDQLWKSGVVGAASGAYSVTGGFGLVKAFGAQSKTLQFGGRLAYQASSTAMSSIGHNWAAGRNPLSRVTVGAGPVNLTLGKNQRLLQWQNNVGNIFFNSVGLLNVNKGGGVRWDWEHLTFSYWGADIHNPYIRYDANATGAHSIFAITETALKNEYIHELNHLWLSRGLNDVFLLNYFLHGLNALFGGNDMFGEANYFERLGYENAWGF